MFSAPVAGGVTSKRQWAEGNVILTLSKAEGSEFRPAPGI
jgi:hypothetical protein